ncbi:MAG: hypothetical protein PVJ84_10535 [Desulfobacteraceae bacterium]|jgi:hypothetical protein
MGHVQYANMPPEFIMISQKSKQLMTMQSNHNFGFALPDTNFKIGHHEGLAEGRM